jgi:hypothetical protein
MLQPTSQISWKVCMMAWKVFAAQNWSKSREAVVAASGVMGGWGAAVGGVGGAFWGARGDRGAATVRRDITLPYLRNRKYTALTQGL